MPALGELAGERAELSRRARRTACSRGASSAVIEGKLTALEIAPLQQIVRHLLGDLQRHVLLRLGGGGAEMRRADDVGMPEQRIARRRLLDEHVEGGARDLAGIERLAAAPPRRPGRRARN